MVYTATASDAADISAGVTFSLKPVGDFAALSINSATGEVRLTGNPNYEGQSSYSFTVLASDGVNPASEQAVSLSIIDVDEFDVTSPVDGNATANAVNENVATGTVVGVTAFASDADATNNTVTYSLTSNAGGLFAIDSSTGVVTTAAAINREAIGASINIQVTATSTDGSTAVQTFTIAINDVDEFDVTTPVDSNATANAVNENVAAGTVVGVTAFASDADATNNTVTYSLTSNPGGLFAIDGSTGVVTTAAAINREASAPAPTSR